MDGVAGASCRGVDDARAGGEPSRVGSGLETGPNVGDDAEALGTSDGVGVPDSRLGRFQAPNRMSSGNECWLEAACLTGCFGVVPAAWRLRS